jgi:hypothetical protein
MQGRTLERPARATGREPEDHPLNFFQTSSLMFSGTL